MRILAFFRSLWLAIVRRERAERSLDDEVRAYVDLLAAEYERAGLAPAEARRRALVETGGVEQVKEATRDAWVGEGLVTLGRELRFTLRALRRAPVFFVIAVTVLAIGIGGATAIFTVIKGSLLQPLPAVSHPEELVSLEPTKGEQLLYDFSYLDYRDLREQTRSLAGLAGFDGTYITLEDGRGPRRSAALSGDVRFASVFDAAAPVAYLPAAQHPGESRIFAVRSRDGGPVPDEAIRRIGAATDERVPIYTRVVTDLIDEQLGPQRVASAWIGVFGVIALLLAAVGLYGVVAQGVLHRTRELAVRSALGATPGELVSLVIGDGMRIAAVGSVVGVAAGAAALRVLQSQFDGVSAGDARGAVVAVAVVCAAMVGACWVPARRAGRMNPVEALRCE